MPRCICKGLCDGSRCRVYDLRGAQMHGLYPPSSSVPATTPSPPPPPCGVVRVVRFSACQHIDPMVQML